MKVIDLLNKIANDTLEDGTRVIIGNVLYVYDRDDKKLYVANDCSKYRNIFTYALNLEVEILSTVGEVRCSEEEKEIEELCIEKDLNSNNYYLIDKDIAKCQMTRHSRIIANKLNEVIKELNKIMKEGK